LKQEISNNVTLTNIKDLEEAVKDMYRKYVRNESGRMASRTVSTPPLLPLHYHEGAVISHSFNLLPLHVLQRLPVEAAIAKAKQSLEKLEKPEKDGNGANGGGGGGGGGGEGAEGSVGAKKNAHSTVHTLLEGLEEANRQVNQLQQISNAVPPLIIG